MVQQAQTIVQNVLISISHHQTLEKDPHENSITSRDTNLDDHFGHCEYFTVFTVDENKKILAEEVVQSPMTCGCKSNIVDTLSAMGVTMMLAGNIGSGAVNVLNNHGIQVLRGCSGNVKAIAQQWLNGTVSDSGITCQQHDTNVILVELLNKHFCFGHIPLKTFSVYGKSISDDCIHNSSASR